MTRPTDADPTNTTPSRWTAADIERERTAAERRMQAVVDRVFAMVILRRAAEMDAQEEAVAA